MDQDDEYYHNAKNRHEMYSLKEGDHVIGELNNFSNMFLLFISNY